MTTTADELREEVRRRYAESARAVTAGSGGCGCGSGSCCGDETEARNFGEALYDAKQRGELPEAATLASLGCGNPTAVAELRDGETVLDLGSGGGIDVILSAKRVGPSGIAYGLDMKKFDVMRPRAPRNCPSPLSTSQTAAPCRRCGSGERPSRAAPRLRKASTWPAANSIVPDWSKEPSSARTRRETSCASSPCPGLTCPASPLASTVVTSTWLGALARCSSTRDESDVIRPRNCSE